MSHTFLCSVLWCHYLQHSTKFELKTAIMVFILITCDNSIKLVQKNYFLICRGVVTMGWVQLDTGKQALLDNITAPSIMLRFCSPGHVVATLAETVAGVIITWLYVKRSRYSNRAVITMYTNRTVIVYNLFGAFSRIYSYIHQSKLNLSTIIAVMSCTWSYTWHSSLWAVLHNFKELTSNPL